MLKTISATLIIGGFIFVLGTAGSSDLGLLTFGQIVVRCIIGLCAIVGGCVVRCIAESVKQKEGLENAQISIHNQRI